MVAFARAALLGIIAFLTIAGGAAAQQEQYLTTSAQQAIIMDYETGTVLFEKNAQTPVPPASMSKLMTVAILMDMLEKGELSPDTPFYVSRKAWQTGGSKMFVLVDTTIPVIDLLKGIIVLSGNDACVVVAENISSPVMGNVTRESELGSVEAFADIMNAKAEEWGLTQSTFANPSGLPDPDQLMSMSDLARLSAKIIRDYPEYYDTIFDLPEFTWSNITQSNRNPLVGAFAGADGLKTGHTDESGYGVAGSAIRDGVRRIVVLHGLESDAMRTRESRRVMGLAFSEFTTRRYFTSGDIVGEADVFLGKQETVPLKIKNNVVFTRHNRILQGAEATLLYEGPVKAPVRAETQVGLLRLEIPGEPPREYPLYTAERVDGIGIAGKMGIGLKALFTPPSARENEPS
ncbi:D-alanyl-D-alanine carboxypeptidase family protein [Aquisalinus flavus]|uniref:serine-type D-Ala-D-Ala carboxypeptidase n=1 Tax=Aquisalinus flavus TaxID=1526572 RepID=A0A8J2V185_9PROT|nr:D-alanyl-D-alanine carboxypeptidase family protein [Aquisalinus flavus]MBD0427739.1 D-alanyl-D-alanine carboxypeptidase [Aquisalinus flavus]UNE47514.1 D-alanyl-D-alanine carboxypeptidase [Aquisalinus flavus]GGD03430.1 D-alanyl-D-alanine carboxypeptidase [Aquisalinus flavus]